MSLLKTYRNDLVSRPFLNILDDFKDAFAQAAEGVITKEDVIALTSFYAEYGVAYLNYISETFEEPKGASDTMKFMNSAVAEAVNEAGLHYFNKERGYSIVDRAVQAAIDNGGVALTSDIMAVINEIEDTYIEDEELVFEDMDEETLNAEE